MFKAWIDLWKNTFHYTGTVTRKEYWSALLMNVIVMYALVVPYALIAKYLTDNFVLVSVIYLIAVHLPVVSLYVRRARGAGWKLGTTLFLAVTIPGLSALMVGAISHCGTVDKGNSLIAKTLAFSFSLFFYGSILSTAIYGDPTSLPFFPIAGLVLASLTLIIYGIIHWRQVLAFFIGSNDH